MSKDEKRPYYCDKCERRHVKGKIYENHLKHAVDCPECQGRILAGTDSPEAFDSCPNCKGGRVRPMDAETIASYAQDAREQEKRDIAEMEKELESQDEMEHVKITMKALKPPNPEDVDLPAIQPGITHIETSAGIMEVIRSADGMPISLFDPTDRTMRANLRLELWEHHEPDPESPDGRRLVQKPFTLCEKIHMGKEIARAQGKKYGFFKRMADIRAYKKFCKEKRENDTNE